MTPHEYQEQQRARVHAMYNPVEPITAPVEITTAPVQELTAPVEEVVIPSTIENEGE